MVYKHHNQCFMIIASVKIQLCYKDRGGDVCEDVAFFCAYLRCFILV